MNLSIQRGIGKGRDSWAIRKFIAERYGLNMSDVARMAKVQNNIVNDTFRGIRNHGRVLAVLEQLGCPEKYLYGEREREAA